MASWAGKIAEWVVSSVVTSLVNTAYNSYLCDRRLSDDSEAELKRLSTALPKIRAVMGIAEALKMRDPNTGLWVSQFRQAAEKSQLVLNELDYLNQDEAGESASSLKKRKRYIINDDTMKKLKDAVTMMDRATAEIDHLLQLATVLGVHGRFESRQEAGEVLRIKRSRQFRQNSEKLNDSVNELKDLVGLKDNATIMKQLIAENNNLLRLATVFGVHGCSESRQEAAENNNFLQFCQAVLELVHIATRLYDLVKRLNDLVKRLKDEFDQQIAEENNLIRLKTVLAFHGRSESRQEAGEDLRLEKQVFVWEVEKHKIIDCLKQSIDACLSSFGTASVGGIGKTTLVERVYQNMDSSIDFGKEIWLCVSTYFSFQGTTTKILVKLDEKNWSRKPLDVVEEAWKEKIHLKKLINRGEFRIFVRVEKDIGFKLRIQDNVSQLENLDL